MQVGTASHLVAIARSRAGAAPRERAYVFLRDGERDEIELDYGTLDRRARRVAAALAAELGDARGERVLLLHPPGLELVTDFLGCLYAGAIAVLTPPPRPNRSMERTEALARDCEPRVVLTLSSTLAARAQLVERAPALAGLAWIATDELDGRAVPADPPWSEREPRPDEIALLQYTSGSTGTPKGVAVSHANLAHNEELLHRAFRTRPGAPLVSWLPLHHDMGLIGMVLQGLYVGAPCVLMSPAHFLERPLRWLAAIARYRAALSCAPNFAYDLCAERVGGAERAELDLSSWETAVNGSEPVRLESLERFADAFAPCGFRREALQPGFGLAEATLIVSFALERRAPVHRWVDERELANGRALHRPPRAAGAKPLVGCGTTMPGQTIAIVDPKTLRPLPDGEVGEIWVSGPSVATGYWNRTDESERTFRARVCTGTTESTGGAETFLRTGDLGFLEHGELFVAGRYKDMLIVRGQNHYPQDLELVAERSHPDLRPFGAAAFAVERAGREELVLAAEVERRGRRGAPEILSAIRAALAEACEIEAAAILLLRPGSLPRTSSGKVRRGATRDAWLRGELALVAEWRAPLQAIAAEPAPLERTPAAIEAWLVRLAAAFVGASVEHVDPLAPLARLGLDSLRVVQLSHELERGLGVRLSLERLYAGASLRDVARDAASAGAAAAPALDSEAAALSFGQRALWFLDRLAPESAAYHLCAAVRILSAFDAAAFERALQALADRHSALRTTIAEGADGAPEPLVRARVAPAFDAIDAAGWSEPKLREELRALARRPFDLEHGPLVRAAWLRRGGEPDVLLLCAHHAVLDHWSLALVLSELGALYAAALRAADADLPAPVPYADFARAQRAWLAGADGEAAWRFWSAELAGAPAPAELPTDRSRPAAQRHRGRTLRIALEDALAEHLASFARERGATPYLVALTAFEVLLARTCGSDRFLFGTLYSGRASAAHAGIVGYLVNPLVVRSDLTGAPSFEAALARAQRRAARSFRHADFPFPLLVERLRPARDASRPPFFQALFAWQPAVAHGSPGEGEAGDLGALALGLEGARVSLGGLALESLELDLGASQFDVSMTLAEVGPRKSDGGARRGLALALEIDADLLDEDDARSFVARYLRVLESALQAPERRVSELELAGDAEREAVAALWNGPALAAESDSVFARLVERARGDASAVALVLGERRVCYGELVARVEWLARVFLERGLGPESIVAVQAGRSLERCVALLAADAAGAAWMAVDPALPEARRQFLIDDARAALVVTTHEHAGLAPPGALILDESGPCPDGERFEPRRVPPEAAAYVLYTSGSSGTPKGVVVSRRSLCALVSAATQAFGLGPGDAVAHMASVGFDLSVEELFPPLCAGARVVVRAESAPPSVAELHELVERERITVLDLPTAYWHLWSSAAAEEQRALPASLRLVIVGGERASSGAYAAWKSAAGAGGTRWMNSYGPTEATVTATVFTPDARAGDSERADHRARSMSIDRAIPIGRAIAGYRAGVLDAAGEPAPIGVPGELAIGGAGVARGYLGDPARTARAFVPDPGSSVPGARMFLTGDRALWRADGELVFLGRRDEQVKVHGFRVEPAEVEAELLRQRDVREAAVVARAGSDGVTRLAAFVVSSAGERELRARLAARLPHYAVPAHIVRVERLPPASSGKVDRRALLDRSIPVQPGERAEHDAAAPDQLALRGAESDGGVEALLARLWEELLGVERVRRGDDFFELGGDSIRTIQLASRAARAGLRVAPVDVFRHPRLQDLARVTAAANARRAELVRGPVPLTPIQRWFLELGLERPAHWNQEVLLEAAGVVPLAALRDALVALARRHDALCLRFAQAGGAWRAEVADPEHAVAAGAVDLGALTGEERDAALARERARAHESLDLERGPLLRAAALQLGRAGPTRLLLVAHHLVIDAVSWRILVDELEAELAASERGEELTQAPAPSPWRAWAEWIGERARWIAPADVGEDDLWPAPLRAADCGGFASLGEDPGLERDEAILSLALDAADTARFGRAGRRSGEEELLVAALAAALAETFGRAETSIDLESHGRSQSGGPDVAGTLGWFTEILSMRFDLAGAATPAERLSIVRRELRAQRKRARALWLARYGGDAALALRMGTAPAPAVSFNYLGRLDGALGRGPLQLISAGRDRAPSARRTHWLEIDARIEGALLQLDWSHPTNARAAIERLSAAFHAHLLALLDTCEDASEDALDARTERPRALLELDQAALASVLEQVDPDRGLGGRP